MADSAEGRFADGDFFVPSLLLIPVALCVWLAIVVASASLLKSAAFALAALSLCAAQLYMLNVGAALEGDTLYLRNLFRRVRAIPIWRIERLRLLGVGRAIVKAEGRNRWLSDRCFAKEVLPELERLVRENDGNVAFAVEPSALLFSPGYEPAPLGLDATHEGLEKLRNVEMIAWLGFALFGYLLNWIWLATICWLVYGAAMFYRALSILVDRHGIYWVNGFHIPMKSVYFADLIDVQEHPPEPGKYGRRTMTLTFADGQVTLDSRSKNYTRLRYHILERYNETKSLAPVPPPLP